MLQLDQRGQGDRNDIDKECYTKSMVLVVLEVVHMNLALEVVSTEEQREEFWKEKNRYLIKDVFPNGDMGVELTREEQSWFFSKEYREALDALCERKVDQGKACFFVKDGKPIGFVFYCIYQSEDGKCFILDYCIYPEFRNQSLGRQCFHLLEENTKKEGASYYELNTNSRKAKHFWETLGFHYNGFDAKKTILLLKKPEETVPICYELLKKDDIWQILNLENGYRYEMDEDFLSDFVQEELKKAIEGEKIYFFVAKRKTRVVGMCSISTVYSTAQTGYMGVFEDMYVEPVFRGLGIAKKIVDYAFTWCKENHVKAVCVGSSENDKSIYGKLGFTVSFGRMLAWINREE